MTKNIKMGHVINLMSIAFADGAITDEEKNLIYEIAEHLGLTDEEFNHCLATWQETDEDILKVSMPETEDERIAFLKNMTLLMMIDGEIDENERQYIANAAEQYGFNGEEAVDALIEMIHDEYGGDKGEDEGEDDDLFEYVDEEIDIDAGKAYLESKEVEEAFDSLFLPALRNEEAERYFMIIPNTDTRLFRLSQEQIELVQKAADRGYPLAKYVLGRYHQVVSPDDDSIHKAAKLLQEATDNGIADAYCALATMHWYGYYGPAVLSEYYQLIDKALDGGSMMAIRNRLQDMVDGSHGMKVNLKKVIDTITNKILTDEDSEKSYPFLYAVLGNAYRAMDNSAKADECYEKAIDLGYFEAYAPRFFNKIAGPDIEFYRETMSMFLDFGCDEKDPDCFMARALETIHFYDKKKDDQKAAATAKIKEDLEEAVALGQGKAAYYLGLCYYHNLYGFEEDNDKAWQWFRKGVQLEDGSSFAGMAMMVDDGICPDGLPEDFSDTCKLNGLRRGNYDLLEDVLKACQAGRLKDFAEEIECIKDLLQDDEEPAPVSTLVIVNTEGQALICHVEKNEWHGVPALIDAKRLAPIRVDGLDEIGKKAGLTERLTVWIDLEAPRKGLPVNKVAAQFYPGYIAGDIIFTLADNLYDPVLFYGTDEAEALVRALGVQLVNPDVQELNIVVKERTHIEPKRNMLINNGYLARIQPDNTAHILPCGKNFFTLFEEEIYDPARLQNLYELGQKLGLPGRLTVWTDNSALRKQIVMMNTIQDNRIGLNFYPGKVADNIFVGMEDEIFNVMMFSDVEQLKQVCVALGVQPEDVVIETQQ
ncbi:MAG: hypothetical protein J6P83_05680 [Bacteroidales bacterium]|nr:hypothetical protein [Bacteroidales bacterium]